MAGSLQILSLGGGGYCGLYIARILERLEEDRGGKPLCESVDFVAGTSIGGILALAVAYGVPAKDIREKMEQYGPVIFKDEGAAIPRMISNAIGTLTSLIGAKYSGKTLAKVIGQFVPNTPISEAKIPLAISSVCWNLASPKVFKNYDDGTEKAHDVALATSAAPTYFPLHKIETNLYLDGGVVANNPDQIALTEALGRFRIRAEDIRLLSVGATNSNLMQGSDRPRFSGLLPQAFALRQTIALTLAAQEKLAEDLTQAVLRDNYLRLNSTPGSRVEQFTRLDRADKKATEVLISMADQKYEQLRAHNVLRHFLNPARTRTLDWSEGRILLSA